MSADNLIKNIFYNFRDMILLTSLFITFWIYKANRWIILKNNSILLVVQIKSITKLLDLIKANYIDQSNKTIQWNKISTMDELFEEDNWESSKHLFIEYLGEEDFNLINNFFISVRKIKQYQHKIQEFEFLRAESQIKKKYDIAHEKIYRGLLNKGKVGILKENIDKYNKYFNRNNPHYHISMFHPDFITNKFISAVISTPNLFGSSAFDKLKLISTRSSWLTLWLSFLCKK